MGNVITARSALLRLALSRPALRHRLDALLKGTVPIGREAFGYRIGAPPCSGCTSFDRERSACLLFEALNEALPDHFAADPSVDAEAGCDAELRERIRRPVSEDDE